MRISAGNLGVGLMLDEKKLKFARLWQFAIIKDTILKYFFVLQTSHHLLFHMLLKLFKEFITFFNKVFRYVTFYRQQHLGTINTFRSNPHFGRFNARVYYSKQQDRTWNLKH